MGYQIVKDGMHDRFLKSRAKVQFLGGGFGNGKTAAVCMKALTLIKDYPGCNGLIARSTYPKLNDTIRPEFFKWCPPAWIKKKPTQDDNTCYFNNGSIVNFRYAAQKVNADTGESTNNLLSATYDWMIVDQIEDPEFEHKDFMDLMGRLRGSTAYRGDDPTMPRVGPRWFILTSNPTRNWVFRELIAPLHDLKRGKYNPKLICQVDDDGKPIVVDGKPQPLIELFEGSTYENVANVGKDYITGMLATFTNESMKRRFIFGEWGALEGLVYPQYDNRIHQLSHETIMEYVKALMSYGIKPVTLHAYDHGIRSPSCYLMGFGDDDGNIFVFDGFYIANGQIKDLAAAMKSLQEKYPWFKASEPMYADPALFRRQQQGGKVGSTVAGMFADEEVDMQRGANDITAGLNKVGMYLSPTPYHDHPVFGTPTAPYLYFSDHLDFIDKEISDYYFNDPSRANPDKPRDKNDHAMDTLKYLLTRRPMLAKVGPDPKAPPAYLQWHEIEDSSDTIKPRHR